MLDDLPGVKGHQQALPRALRVPDHPDLAVTCRPGRLQRAGHSVAHGVELVIAGDDFDQPAAGIAEDDKILQLLQKAVFVEDAFQQGFQLGRAFGRDLVPVHRAPGHEALAAGGERADTGIQPVGNHQDAIGTE